MEIKTAILICGNVRTWKSCQSKEWINISGYDVFLSTYTLHDSYHKYILSQIVDYVGDREINIQEDILGDLDNVISYEIFDGKLELETSFSDIYSQFHCMARGINLIKEHETKTNTKYTNIIKIRPDLNYLYSQFILSINEPIPEKVIIITDYGIYPSDTMIIGNRDIIMQLPDYFIKYSINPPFHITTGCPHTIFRYIKECLEIQLIAYPICEINRPF